MTSNEGNFHMLLDMFCFDVHNLKVNSSACILTYVLVYVQIERVLCYMCDDATSEQF